MKDRSGSPFAFLWPWMVGAIVLTFVPLAASLVLSLADVEWSADGVGLKWVGTQHYQAALGTTSSTKSIDRVPWICKWLNLQPRDPRLWTALSNSLSYTICVVPLGLLASLGVALLLHRNFAGMSIVRGCVYVPHLLGGAASIVIWSWLLNPQFGWINSAIRFVYATLDPVVRFFGADGTAGWPVPLWLYSPEGCKPAVILMNTWVMGGAMLVFLAALRRVPIPLQDAARLDGAGQYRRFLHVTLPQISPVIFFNAVVSIVFSMQAFVEPYLLQNRQQDDGLLFAMVYLYEVAFEVPYRLGYAAAVSWILLLATALLVLPVMGSARRWVYEAFDR